MTETTSYPHGVPSWLDLATPDPDGSKSFYGELFGWTFDDQPTGRAGVDYTMANKGDKAAAGMMQLSEEMAASGMPPVWSTYVTVDDIEAAVAKVDSAGGAVMQPPVDVMEAGRMSVLADPAGAVICLWEAKDHAGAEVVNEHGALVWNELMTPDPQAVAPFYADVLGWTNETAPMPTGNYTLFLVEGGSETGIAGAMKPPMPGMPPFWGIYFQVDDTAAICTKAADLGATVQFGPEAIPGVGTMATITDPQGATFSVMTPEEG
jgi:predicted enzyme related to lactoylglutathione lyase